MMVKKQTAIIVGTLVIFGALNTVLGVGWVAWMALAAVVLGMVALALKGET